ncbi:Hpt domain-containing protein [Desulfopila inferna]|uniref:Hpt domain-containing protein n=1 Tax=Desulfopila inferna TaxID=468528 RepID=UPI0019631850|nr:Hpt domain-containing protein [Desulfopila inferna]MBM9603207.1 Hpt domain-containing protein [Desulfopila inferna]
MGYLKFSSRIKTYLAHHFKLPEEQIELMLPEFKKTLSSHMENLERIYRQDSLIDLQKAAHTIKGAFLNLGLQECAELAKKIEYGAADNDTTVDYAALIDRMRHIVDDIVNDR